MHSQRARSIRDFFALEHNIVVLLAALLVIGMGQELWIRFMPKYLEVLGASAVAIGAYGSFKRVVGLYYLIRGMITIPAPFLGGLLWQHANSCHCCWEGPSRAWAWSSTR